MKFIPGLTLNRKYYDEVVGPLLKKFDFKLSYSAGLIGYGSDVLGFDDATSMDHNWGPRLQIFVGKNDAHRIGSINVFLKDNLPCDFLGFPTNFSEKGPDGTQKMVFSDSTEVNHLIEIYEIDLYFQKILRKDLSEMDNIDWLIIPEQELVEITSGSIFYDGLKRLSKIRSKLKYYPHQVKLIKLASYWHRIANEEAFVGRAVELNDILGLKIITARIVKNLLKICFVLKDTYVPYSKWFTHKFEELNLPEIKELSRKIIIENDPNRIENLLANLYFEVLKLQNISSNLPKIEKGITTYYNRPYKVIFAEEIVNNLKNSISDPKLKNINISIVGIDNEIDSIDFSENHLLEKFLQKE